MGDKGPAWLMGKIDQRIAMLEDKAGAGLAATNAQVIMTSLTEPQDFGLTDFKTWDRTCDGCGTHVPEDQDFATGHYKDVLKSGQPVIITFGICTPCRELP